MSYMTRIAAAALSATALLGATAPGAIASPGADAPAVVDVPSEAVPATGEALTHAMEETWIPQPAGAGAWIKFTPQGGIQGFSVDGGPCNGYGTAIHPNPDTGTFTATGLPVTRMACDTLEYEGAVTQAFRQGGTFYLDGEDTLYVVGDQGALKLTRAQ